MSVRPTLLRVIEWIDRYLIFNAQPTSYVMSGKSWNLENEGLKKLDESQSVRPTLLRQMAIGSLTCTHMWMHALHTKGVVRHEQVCTKSWLGGIGMKRVNKSASVVCE